jgi:TonB-dependent receptor
MPHRIARTVLVGLLASASATALAGLARAADPTEDTSSVSGVTITAPREEVKARQVQKLAPNIVRVQSAETIAKYPDYNAAEALGRIPDISLSSDTGEGRFVQIRGIDANLNGATYGGVVLLNTFPGGTESSGGGRAVEFDTIPTGAIDGIVVTLMGLPDHEAEGLGGSIELSPRTAAHIVKPFIEATLGGGYEPLHGHAGPYDAEIAVGARFGFGDHGLDWRGDDDAPRAGFFSNPRPFSFVLTGSFREDRRAVDDLEESYIDDEVAQTNAISGYDFRRYNNYHRERFGYGGEFDFQPNDDHQWFIRADIAGYTESNHKNFLLFRGLGDTEVFPPGPGPFGIPLDPAHPAFYQDSAQARITLTDEQETHRNQIYVIGGKDQFGDLQIDYRTAYSKATFHEDHNLGAQFRSATQTGAFDYNNTLTPNYPIYFFTNGFNVNDPHNYKLKTVSNSFEYDDDHEWSFAGNAAYPLHLWGGQDQLKAGFEVRLRNKSVAPYRDSFNTPPAISLAAPGISFPALMYYHDHFTNGPQIDMYAIRGLVSNGTLSKSGPAQLQLGSVYQDKEDIYAGYIQYTGQWGPWGLLAGVRVEETRADYGAYVDVTTCTVPLAADGSCPGDTVDTTSFLVRPSNYTNAFPTVQIRYDFSPTLLARFTYSTGIGRPGFTQDTTSASVDLSQEPNLVTRGNPNLKPTLGDSFDLSLEDYLPGGGILEIGLFDKEFTNYIAERVLRNVPDPLVPAGNEDIVTTFVNIPSAYARGIDAAWHQQFLFLPKPWDGFGIDANVTAVKSHMLEYDSSISLSGRNEFGSLPGTSALTWNLSGFYEANGLQLRLSTEFVSHSLFGLSNNDRFFDTIQDDRLTLDWTSSYEVTHNVKVYFNVKNLLNTPLRYYEGASDRPIQREFYGPTYEAGVRVHY